MPYLIINADDFGLTTGINRAVYEAQRSGVLRSAGLMSNAPGFDDAVAMAREIGHRSLSVGCHVVLVDGKPISPSGHIPSLLGGREIEGFRSHLRTFTMAALSGQLNENEIERETIAQITRIIDVGVAVSHIDTHKHTHWFPQVFRPIIRAARICGVRAIRNPFPFAALPRSCGSHWWAQAKRCVKTRLLLAFRTEFMAEVRKNGLVTTNGSFGVFDSTMNDMGTIRVMLGMMGEGIWELVCHPGYNDEALSKVRTTLRDSRDRERRLLVSPDFRATLNTHGIELINYFDAYHIRVGDVQAAGVSRVGI